jgi:hypothetical protein
MKVIVELESAQAARLQQEADRLGISPSELAKAAVVDLLSTHDPAFSAAAERVLNKNRELYRRLA